MKRIIAFIILMLLLAACASLPSQATQGLESSTKSTSGSTTNTANIPILGGRPQLDGAIIVYERYGGLAGISEKVSIYADGRIDSSNGNKPNLSSDQVNKLLSNIETAGFFKMQDAYGTSSQCRDCFTYRLTANLNGQVKTVQTNDGASDTPSQLWDLIQQINNLVSGQ